MKELNQANPEAATAIEPTAPLFKVTKHAISKDKPKQKKNSATKTETNLVGGDNEPVV
jgi:hypothetical protein